MKKIQWIIPLTISLFIFGVGSLEAAKYKVIKGGVKNGGMVSGSIILNPPPSAVKMLKVDKDTEICGGDRPSEELVVSEGGGVKNAVISIEGIKSGKKWGFPKKFVYDQKKCRFVPHLMLVKAKTKGTVWNSDNVGHNFHTVSKGIFSINKKIKANAKMVVKKNKIKRPGVVRVKCDLHSWMKGWWVVAETPYTVLSDENGNFSITDIPPGTYKLKVWQEKLGKTEQDIVIKAGETTKMDVELSL